MGRYMLNNVIGVLLGLANVVILKMTNPRAVSLRRTLKRLTTDPKAIHVFDAEQFALLMLDRYREVFDRLAEM